MSWFQTQPILTRLRIRYPPCNPPPLQSPPPPGGGGDVTLTFLLQTVDCTVLSVLSCSFSASALCQG